MDTSDLLITTTVGVVASVVTAYLTVKIQARNELRKWRDEFAIKYAEASASDPLRPQALARQFAIGVLVVEHGGTERREKAFIAPNCRLTAGIDPNNEIVIDHFSVSKRHVAFSADQSNVYVEDLGSRNGTWLNGVLVNG